jgi:hypothetical protein
MRDVNNDSPDHLRFLRGVLGHDQIDQRPVIKPPRTVRGFLAGIGNLIVGIALVLRRRRGPASLSCVTSSAG